MSILNGPTKFMEKLLPFIIILISKVNDNIEELYRDEEFYIMVFWWCIALIILSLIFGRALYLILKKRDRLINPFPALLPTHPWVHHRNYPLSLF